MNLTALYNHARMIQEARQGMAIVNATKQWQELQLYKVGDIVKSTGCSTYRFDHGKIIEVYKDNGYYRYVVQLDGCTRTARTKDIALL